MVYGVYYFCLSKDGISSKKLKQIPDADLIKPSLAEKKYPEKRIIFIRHGESDWNLIFNKGILKLPFRLFFAILREVKLFASGDSSFYDSPLNKEGIDQAFDLKKSLAKVDTLRDKSDTREVSRVLLMDNRFYASSF